MTSLGASLTGQETCRNGAAACWRSLERNISVCVQVFARHAEKGAHESGACKSAPERTTRDAPVQNGLGLKTQRRGAWKLTAALLPDCGQPWGNAWPAWPQPCQWHSGSLSGMNTTPALSTPPSLLESGPVSRVGWGSCQGHRRARGEVLPKSEL